MFNKFKIGQKVRVKGIDKNEEKYYSNEIGKVVEKDDFFCDYLVTFNNDTSDWFDEKYLTPIRNYKKRRNE